MALDLLYDNYGEGKVTRRYYHELEAFIWILPFVFLAYNNGKLDPKNRFIKYWITSDYITCRGKKKAFLYRDFADSVSLVGSAFENYKMLMFQACLIVRKQVAERQNEADEIFLQRMLPERGRISRLASHIEHPASMWDQFIPVLSHWGLDTTGLQQYRATFDRSQCQDLLGELESIYHSLRLPASSEIF